MVKPEWGVKRVCNSCGAAFYDLRRDPIVCPKCGTEYDPEAVLKSRRARPVVVEKEPVPVIEDDAETLTESEDGEDIAVGEDGIAETADDDEDAELIEDTSDLGEDEDDMAEVIENIEDEEER